MLLHILSCLIPQVLVVIYTRYVRDSARCGGGYRLLPQLLPQLEQHVPYLRPHDSQTARTASTRLPDLSHASLPQQPALHAFPISISAYTTLPPFSPSQSKDPNGALPSRHAKPARARARLPAYT